LQGNLRFLGSLKNVQIGILRLCGHDKEQHAGKRKKQATKAEMEIMVEAAGVEPASESFPH
jgi:hypothetical protein